MRTTSFTTSRADGAEVALANAHDPPAVNGDTTGSAKRTDIAGDGSAVSGYRRATVAGQAGRDAGR